MTVVKVDIRINLGVDRIFIGGRQRRYLEKGGEGHDTFSSWLMIT
jgi:hypothetical protein